MKATDILARRTAEAQARAAAAIWIRPAPLTAPRGAFPLVRAVVSGFRQAFGDQVALTYASEGGQEIGAHGPRGVAPVLPMRELERLPPPKRKRRSA